MYSTTIISPLSLHLDEKNPRFKISIDPSQDEIREYMLVNENLFRLAKKMSQMNTLLPGERIVIYDDNGKNIVLEGNRRACVYQMFLNRTLIPQRYVAHFPIPSNEFISEITKISVDVVPSREGAMSFLAARHIEGVAKWSSISKWRISYECYEEGMTLQEISSHLVLKISDIKKNIENYKLLLRGINHPIWSKEEQEKLNLLDIKPDKLIRIIRSEETGKALKLYFDETYTLKSTIIPDKDLEQIIAILTRKAFIDNTISTRSTYKDIVEDLQSFVPKGDSSSGDSPSHGDNTGAGSGTEGKEKASSSTVNGATNNGNGNTSGATKSSSSSNDRGTGGQANIPYFFNGLLFGHLSADDPNTHGLSRICFEIKKFTDKKMVREFPISSAFLARAIIEHSLIYYAKTHDIQGTTEKISTRVFTNGEPPKLSKLVDNYQKGLSNYITDSKIRSYFQTIFDNYQDVADRFNWVIHRPDEYVMHVDDLISLPSGGLLAVINYLIS